MKVLLLSSNASDRSQIAEWLGTRGYSVVNASDAVEALGAANDLIEFAFVDLAARVEAIKFLRAVVSREPHIWTIAITDRRDAGATSDALRLGVVDIVRRPLHLADIVASLANAREFAGHVSRLLPMPPDPPEGTIFTGSPRMSEIYDLARRVSTSRCPVLIVGERGTGRETVARAIHRHGPLRDAEFARALGKDLDPDALRRALERGDGIFYVEDMGDLAPRAQLWLEEWLTAHPHSNGDGSGPKCPRLIVSSRPRIDVFVTDGRFRRGLFEAVSVVRLDLPPLRERPQDIPLLALHFLKEACAHNELQPKTLSRSAVVLLAALPWRDNAGELRGLIERLAVLVPRGVILQEDVLQHLRFDDVHARGTAGGTLREARLQFEREFIALSLQRHQWRMEPAAAELGVERTNLYRKMKQLSITRGDAQ